MVEEIEQDYMLGISLTLLGCTLKEEQPPIIV